jgi:hypothetical protein
MQEEMQVLEFPSLRLLISSCSKILLGINYIY